MTVRERAEAATLEISTQATVAGKLGEFGQPVIRKKADQMMAEFSRNVKEKLSAG
ncbi:MAG: SRPBCC family protein [Chloroflexota bacterium]